MWLKEIQEKDSHSNFQIIILGNKLDLDDKRQVTYEEASNYAVQRGIKYFEVSAKNNTNLEEVFQEIGSLSWKEFYDDSNQSNTTTNNNNSNNNTGKVDISQNNNNDNNPKKCLGCI